MAVLAQSVGAVTGVHLGPRLRPAGTLRWCSPHRPSRSSSTSPSPARACALMKKLRGNFYVNSYVKSKFLTHDPARQAQLQQADPLIARAISVNILLGLYEAAERVVTDAARPSPYPTQLLISGADWVVHHHGHQHRFLRSGSARHGQGEARPRGFLPRHPRRRKTANSPPGKARGFILRQFDHPAPHRWSLLDADRPRRLPIDESRGPGPPPLSPQPQADCTGARPIAPA
jgi:hypothetical protein